MGRGRPSGRVRGQWQAYLMDVHQYQHIPPTSSNGATPLRYVMLAAAGGLVLTTSLGIIMAFRFSRRKAAVLVCLGTGVAVRVVLLLIYR